MSYRLSFDIQGLPKTPNQLSGGHWRKKSDNTKKWRTLVWSKAWPDKPPMPLTKAKVTLTRFSSGRPMDEDNLISSFKPVLDGLVRAGVILDDKKEIIGRPECFHEKVGPKQGKIRVLVEAE